MDTDLVDSKINTESQSNHYLALQLNGFLAQFKALALEVTDQIENQEKNLEKKLSKTEGYLEEQLQKLTQEIESYKELLVSANGAHFRNELKRLFEKSEQHVDMLKSVHDEIQTSVKSSCQQFKQVSDQASNAFSATLANIRPDEFKQYAESSCRRIEKTSSYIVRRMSAMINWFHWKNIFLALGITIVATLMLALYINDEAPWESHRIVKQERLAGATLMKIWPQLSEADRKLIADTVKGS